MDNNITADEILQELPAQFTIYLNKDLNTLSAILQQTIKPKKAPACLAERILKATVFKDAA